MPSGHPSKASKMADTTTKLDLGSVTIGVVSGASGKLVGRPLCTYDIYNVGASGQDVFFNMVGGTVVATGTTGTINQFRLAAGGQLEWSPNYANAIITCMTEIGTSILSIKRRGT
jgi:hypothetical protein